MPDSFQRFCALSELPRGEKKHAKLSDTWVLVCNVNDKLYAVSGVCSHQEKPLWNGRVKGGKITCPVHGARFDLETGEALDLPATRPIATFEVRVVDDWIEVRV